MKSDLIVGKYTLESLTNGMYASPFDMYREYIQNSVDSFDDAIETGIEYPEKLRIDITINVQEKSVEIYDNGCGIKADSAISKLLDIGNSQKNNQTSRGFRGIGRLAGLSYCDKLTFKTSYKGEKCCTIIEFDAKLLKELLLPGTIESVSIEDVINKVVTIRTEKEAVYQRYFKVSLEGVWEEAGLTNLDNVRDYLFEHAPIYFSNSFKWGHTIEEKMRLKGYSIPKYHIFLNNAELFKAYGDTFLADRVKRNYDHIQDVTVETFYRGETLSAVLWYAETSYFGTVIDNIIKGIRIRQGNILVGDKGSCSSLFKEERFNGWMIGELYIVDKEIIANSRRDGFEQNSAYFELFDKLKDWASVVSKKIRHLSYDRNLSKTKREIAKAENVNEICDENDLFCEDLAYTDDFSESFFMGHSESDELAETDFVNKLGLLIGQKKSQTKYLALNINDKLTMEQRRTLERVFDLIIQKYDQKTADSFVNTISSGF